MLNPARLSEFKRITREDELIGDLVFEFVKASPPSTMLEVGAGPGVVSQRLIERIKTPVGRAIIEPQVSYQYPADTEVFRTRWEDFKSNERFDLILMSHVIGHFVMENRGEIVARAADYLTGQGSLIIVENAPSDPFWGLNIELGRRQSMQYIVDFESLELAMRQRGASYTRDDLLIPLFLGHSLEEQLRNFNVLFPSEFSDADRRLARSCWKSLFPSNDGWLQLHQRVYVARRQTVPQ